MPRIKNAKFFVAILLIFVSCTTNMEETDVQSTQTVQSEIDSLVSEGVAATLAAIHTGTAVPVDQMSEEELAAEIETSTNEAVSAVDEAVLYAEVSSSDGEITQEELDELYYLTYLGIDELEQALYLMDLYYGLYDELIDEAIDLLESMDDELQALVDFSEAMISQLDNFSEMISQGGQVLQENLDGFQTSLEDFPGRLEAITNMLPEWMQSRRTELDHLVDSALSVLPEEIANTRREALAIVKDYLSSVTGAIADGSFSFSELENISQLGANAISSINEFGGEFTGVSDLITGLTSSFARGQLPQINAGIGSLQNAIPSIR